MSHKLSIITVCYNEKGVEATCKSIVSQAWQDFEWIVIDGGSDSWCTDILEKYREHMTFYVSEKDNGIYDAMNKGISHAKGEYTLFMNAGDTFLNKKTLERVSTHFSKNSDVFYGDVVLKQQDSSYTYKLFPSNITDVFFIRDCLAHQSAYIRTSLFQKYGNYSTEYKIVSDWKKWIRLIQAGVTFTHLPFLCTIYDCAGISTKNEKLSVAERESILPLYFTEEAINANTDYYTLQKVNSHAGSIEAIASPITSEENLSPPHVSIIVPVFNAALYLNKCIDSLLAQTYTDIEIIFINDASYDNSLDILEDYSRKDSRIRIYSFDENMGVAHSRNVALSKARGEYIGFVDSDDWLDAHFYEKLYATAQNGDYDIVKGNCSLAVGDTCTPTMTLDNIERGIKEKQFLGIAFKEEFGMALYRRTFLQKIDAKFPRLANGEDAVFLLNILLHKPTFSFVKDTYYYYRQIPYSANHSYSILNIKSMYEHFDILSALLNESALTKTDYMHYYIQQIYVEMLSYYKNVVFFEVKPKDAAHYLTCICNTMKNCKYHTELMEQCSYPSLVKFINGTTITEKDIPLFQKEIFLNSVPVSLAYYKYLLLYKLSKGKKRQRYKKKFHICKKIKALCSHESRN